MNNYVNQFKVLIGRYIPQYACSINYSREIGYDLQYISGGGVLLEFNNKTYELEKGGCWVNQPGINYKYRPLDKYGYWDHRYFHFQGEICETWKELELINSNICRIPSKLSFAERIDRIIFLSKQDTPLSRIESRNLTEKLLIDMKNSKDPEANQPAWLSGLIEELEFKPGYTVDYASLQEKYGISQRSMFRTFKKATGLTPHTYHLKSKMSYITELLEMTDTPLKEIAQLTGYNDVFYFSRQYKQLTGVSPAKFRENSMSSFSG